MKRTPILLALIAATAFAVAAPLDASKKAEKAKRAAEAQYVSDKDDVMPILTGGGAALGGAVYLGSRLNPDSAPRSAEPVPEPASLVALGVGVVALLRRRKGGAKHGR